MQKIIFKILQLIFDLILAILILISGVIELSRRAINKYYVCKYNLEEERLFISEIRFFFYMNSRYFSFLLSPVLTVTFFLIYFISFLQIVRCSNEKFDPEKWNDIISKIMMSGRKGIFHLIPQIFRPTLSGHILMFHRSHLISTQELIFHRSRNQFIVVSPIISKSKMLAYFRLGVQRYGQKL
jgi:AraC-like DNA-binding protein